MFHRRSGLQLLLILALAMLVAGVGSQPAAAQPAGQPTPPVTGPPQNPSGNPGQPGIPHHPSAQVCPGPVAPGTARCFSDVRTDVQGQSPLATNGGGAGSAGATTSATTNISTTCIYTPNAPNGGIGNNGAYDPCYLRLAYNLTSLASTGGTGATVAIVDAYDDPSAATDLTTYRSTFGLRACPSSGRNPCFTKVNQTGRTGPLPPGNSGWAPEISLDLDMVSAICPNCHILLVEANSAAFTDLSTAENYAASQHVAAISNSYGGSEWSGETSLESAYDHLGTAITVSSGDSGYGVEYPAASEYVTAVGGTSLDIPSGSTSRPPSGAETAWSDAGSGCSTYILQPTWQNANGLSNGCKMRMVADVSAVANPDTPVWVRYAYNWYWFGGTSVASPIVASVYALVGNTSTTGASHSYSAATSLYDIVSGSNGSCGPDTPTALQAEDLCTAGTGWDGPTGNGTPNGAGAF